jgi:uncharacterized protein
MRFLLALLAGALFGAGLAISGMADPARVQGFLDLLGLWDPTLAFVMAGALLPMAVAWRLQAHMKQPVLESTFDVPNSTSVDKSLALGSILFGIGWGVSGLCPGPSFANLALAPVQVLPFVAAMLAGMGIYRFTQR